LKIEFADTQNLEVIHDKLHKVNHILTSNLEVFNTISNLMGENPAVRGQQPSGQLNGSDNRLAFCTDETETQCRRINTLFQRINAASGLVWF